MRFKVKKGRNEKDEYGNAYFGHKVVLFDVLKFTTIENCLQLLSRLLYSVHIIGI
jgi:hypothetical protein